VTQSPLVLIGRFAKPYGLKGQIKVQWFVDTLDDLSAFERFFIEDQKSIGGYKEIAFSEIKEYPKAYVARIHGIEDRTGAEGFVGKSIYVREDEFPQLPEGEYYVKDILGCKVLYEGSIFGVVDNFFEVGPTTLFVIKTTKGKSLAVPYTERYFVRIDITNKQVEAGHLSELL